MILACPDLRTLATVVISTGFFSAFLVNDLGLYDIKPRRERHEQPTGNR